MTVIACKECQAEIDKFQRESILSTPLVDRASWFIDDVEMFIFEIARLMSNKTEGDRGYLVAAELNKLDVQCRAMDNALKVYKSMNK